SDASFHLRLSLDKFTLTNDPRILLEPDQGTLRQKLGSFKYDILKRISSLSSFIKASNISLRILGHSTENNFVCSPDSFSPLPKNTDLVYESLIEPTPQESTLRNISFSYSMFSNSDEFFSLFNCDAINIKIESTLKELLNLISMKSIFYHIYYLLKSNQKSLSRKAGSFSKLW